MPLLIKCPFCGTFLADDRKACETQTGKGCGKRIPAEKRVYYAYWRDLKGNTQRKKIGPSKAAADNFLRGIETALAEGRYIDRKLVNRQTVGEHIKEDYLPYCRTRNRGWGLRNKELHCKYFIDRLGPKLLQDVSTDELEKWRRDYAEQGKFHMWNRLFQSLRAMYRRAVEKGVIEKLPFMTKGMLFTEDAERVRYLTQEEETKLLNACSDRLRPLVVAAIHTGLRKSDLLALRLGLDVDLEARAIKRKQGKTGSGVNLFITDALAEALLPLCEGKKAGDSIFSLSDQQVKVDFAAAVQKAEIVDPNVERVQDFHFHDLRHCFACKLVNAGVGLDRVRKYLGHTSTKMVDRYAHLAPETVANDMAKLDQPRPGGKLIILPTAASK